MVPSYEHLRMIIETLPLLHHEISHYTPFFFTMARNKTTLRC